MPTASPVRATSCAGPASMLLSPLHLMECASFVLTPTASHAQWLLLTYASLASTLSTPSTRPLACARLLSAPSTTASPVEVNPAVLFAMSAPLTSQPSRGLASSVTTQPTAPFAVAPTTPASNACQVSVPKTVSASPATSPTVKAAARPMSATTARQVSPWAPTTTASPATSPTARVAQQPTFVKNAYPATTWSTMSVILSALTKTAKLTGARPMLTSAPNATKGSSS